MGWPPVCGDNPLALASGLSYAQVDKHLTFYITYISVDLAHHEIFRAKVGKGDLTAHACFKKEFTCMQKYINIMNWLIQRKPQ